jgi:hypothetical protein
MNLKIEQYKLAFEGAKMMYENKEISKEEYLVILQGFDLEKSITENAEEMREKEELNKIITNTINVISMVA